MICEPEPFTAENFVRNHIRWNRAYNFKLAPLHLRHDVLLSSFAKCLILHIVQNCIADHVTQEAIYRPIIIEKRGVNRRGGGLGKERWIGVRFNLIGQSCDVKTPSASSDSIIYIKKHKTRKRLEQFKWIRFNASAKRFCVWK